LATKSYYAFTTVRAMKYTSQHCYDNTMDGKMALYRKGCFPNGTKSWQKITFVGFRWAIAPPLDPPLVLSLSQPRAHHSKRRWALAHLTSDKWGSVGVTPFRRICLKWNSFTTATLELQHIDGFSLSVRFLTKVHNCQPTKLLTKTCC